MRRQVPLSVVDDPASNWWRFRLERRDRLLPRRDPHVDFICKRILEGGEFVLEDSLMPHAAGAAHHGEDPLDAPAAEIRIVRNA
jgi:hypothetical protein